MDVLIVCPVYNRLFAPTLRSIFNLAPADGRLDVFFPWCGYGDGERDSRDIIADKYNAGRTKALEGGYDAMLTIESDMVVPQDAITRLLACDADVAYGMYIFRRMPYAWSAYSYMFEEARMTGIPLSNVPERARADWGKVVDVDGVGLGCTLIKRHVLEASPFRADGGLHADGTRSHCDWYFAIDVLNAGFTQRCDTGLLCGHITELDRDGKVNPSVLWPDIDAPELVRFETFGYDENGAPIEDEAIAA
jgi:hypothetical protein